LPDGRAARTEMTALLTPWPGLSTGEVPFIYGLIFKPAVPKIGPGEFFAEGK